MSTFSGITRVTFDAKYADSGDLVTPSVPVPFQHSTTWASGNANRFYEETISLAAAAVNRDLFGALTDIFGNTINLVTLRALYIVNKSTTASDVLTIDGNFFEERVLGAAGDLMKLGPGGILHLENPIDGYAVTNGTQERITLDPGANSFDVDFAFIGVE